MHFCTDANPIILATIVCVCAASQHPQFLLLLPSSRGLNLSSNKSLHCLRVYIIFIHCTCGSPLSLSLFLYLAVPVTVLFH